MFLHKTELDYDAYRIFETVCLETALTPTGTQANITALTPNGWTDTATALTPIYNIIPNNGAYADQQNNTFQLR